MLALDGDVVAAVNDDFCDLTELIDFEDEMRVEDPRVKKAMGMDDANPFAVFAEMRARNLGANASKTASGDGGFPGAPRFATALAPASPVSVASVAT